MARINNQLIKGKSMRITSLLIMVIASLGIVCQADAATRCASDHVADRGASAASLNAVAQYAFSPSSVASLVPGQFINSVVDITPSWLYGIVVNGENIYAPGGPNNMGIYPIGIYSTPAQLMRSLPGTFFLPAIPLFQIQLTI